MAHQWVHMTPDSLIPPLAVIGELNTDNLPAAYVGRSSHEGGTFTARVVSNEHCAYISWAGSQIKKTDYEILVGENYKFIEYAADGIPFRAVRVGNTAQGEPLYVGRGIFEGNQIVGKIHPIHQCMFVAFGGREHRLDSYEVLVRDPPSSTVVPIVMKTNKANEDLVDKPEPQPSSAENSKYEMEKPVIDEPTTVDSAPDEDNATEVLFTPEDLIYEMKGPLDKPTTDDTDPDEHTWVSLPFSEISPNAVIAGKDTNGSVIYVGRATDNKNMKVPAKIIPPTEIASYSVLGTEVKIDNFEVLVGDGYTWVKPPDSKGTIPIGAVSTGKDESGNRIFIGRGHFGGALTPGRVRKWCSSVRIPFDGKEIVIDDEYEILVRN